MLITVFKKATSETLLTNPEFVSMRVAIVLSKHHMLESIDDSKKVVQPGLGT